VLEPAVRIPPHDDTVIAFDRVSVIRSGNFLVRGLSWQVELDERWVILGPNGAGKTTLLNLASGRLHPSRGAAYVLGERLGRTDVNELRTRIGLSTGQFGERIPPAERVIDVVVTAAWSVVGRWRETYDPMDTARARQLLEQLGMGALLECLDDARVSSVLVVGRRSVGIHHPKLDEIIHQDFFHYDAIQSRNYPIVRGGVLVVAILFVLANLLADLSYRVLDPRIRDEAAR